jgi:hypothetical protein
MKTVFAPHIGREVRLGGCNVDLIHLRHALGMKHVMRAGAVNFTPPTFTTFSKNNALTTLLSQMFENNQLGDCVIAARARRTGLLTGNATGTAFIYTDAQINTEYGRVGGYVVGDASTDQGCDPAASADDGVKNGYADGSRDAGWVAVDAANFTEVMIANDVTNGACDLSMALPDAWVGAQMPQKNGDVWDVAGDPNPANGHNVAVIDHDVNHGVLIDTWGLEVWVTWKALAKYGIQANGGMLIAHMNMDAIAKSNAKAPNGYDWATMTTFFDTSLGGSIPVVPNIPLTGGRTTLAQAQAIVAAGIHTGGVLQTRGGAAKLAQDALAKLTW